MAPTVRDRVDACPGALTTHQAADGPLARIRTPGGRLDASQLVTLADCAEHLGDGEVHLTSRANVQLRAVADVSALAERLTRAGLLPSASHERVRNIVASPLSGITGGLVDVRTLVIELDHALRAEPALARLPGRFQFGLDDGRGDLPPAMLDAGWRATDSQQGALLLGGADTGLRIPARRASAALVAAAHAFLDVRARTSGTAWHIRELNSQEQLTAVVADTLGPDVRTAPTAALTTSPPPAVGPHQHRSGPDYAVVAAIPLGTFTAAQLRTLAGLSPRGAVLTPWRSVVLPGLPPGAAGRAVDTLVAAGYVLDPESPSAGVTACIGHPGCASSRADVRADTLPLLTTLPPGITLHVSGCERRCGRPRGPHVDAVAAMDGYVVDGIRVARDELAIAVPKAASQVTSEAVGTATTLAGKD
ncbi:precorrin-3B synthase [Phytoactinopolyspora limicola]|uniref:precorrin-3B synthase n=1 Tax=Phytoactinopolyspora limicola TaxID=2715536 RepID=UPI00140CB413|nr:precorrin-3B synthase [Phytoactinopolyspora limicola]